MRRTVEVSREMKRRRVTRMNLKKEVMKRVRCNHTYACQSVQHMYIHSHGQDIRNMYVHTYDSC